jgi:hypothetical protein
MGCFRHYLNVILEINRHFSSTVKYYHCGTLILPVAAGVSLGLGPKKSLSALCLVLFYLFVSSGLGGEFFSAKRAGIQNAKMEILRFFYNFLTPYPTTTYLFTTRYPLYAIRYF